MLPELLIETITPEQDARIRELPALITKENDAGKIKLLAAELEYLLTLQLSETKSEPQSGSSC
jgi:hypothetical protein